MEKNKIFKRHLALYGGMALEEYSAKLWRSEAGASKKPEPLFLNCIGEQLTRLGEASDTAEKLVRQLETYPILQTAHHMTPTQGPGFNAADVNSLAGLPDDMLYPVGACSGTAYSNTAFTGSLCFNSANWQDIFMAGTQQLSQAVKAQEERSAHGTDEKRVSLLPAKYRDALVYNSPLPDSVSEKINGMVPALKDFLPPPQSYSLYSDWVLRAQQKMQRSVFGRNNILYFDLSRVATGYLSQSLASGDSRICNYLCDEASLQRIAHAFDDPILFLESIPGKKSYKIGKIKASDLMSLIAEPAQIKARLESLEWCPAVHLVFYATAYLNGLKCLGSFHQCDYLPEMLKVWREFFGEGEDAEDALPSLTSGRLFDESGGPVYSLDCLLSGKVISLQQYASMRMEDFWRPIAEKLVASN